MAKITWGTYEPPVESEPFGECQILPPAASEQLKRALLRRSGKDQATPEKLRQAMQELLTHQSGEKPGPQPPLTPGSGTAGSEGGDLTTAG